MANVADIFRELKKQSDILKSIGAEVILNPITGNASLPAITNALANVTTPIIQAETGYIIRVAELPNVKVVIKQNGNQIATQTINAAGGYVDIPVNARGTYQVFTYVNNIEKWSSEIGIWDYGAHPVKSPLKLNSYTWEEIQLIAERHIGQYMFDLWDYKECSFMGSITAKAYFADFDNVDLVDGGTAGMTFMFKDYSGTYKHWNSNINGVSWVGSLIRKNCMEAGEIQYIYDNTVTTDTIGTYYIYNTETNIFDLVELDGTNFDSTKKYYITEQILTEGTFLTSIKSNITPKKVINKT